MTVTLPKPAPPQGHPLSPRNLWSAALSSYVAIVVVVLIVALPLLWMVLSSFKSPAELITTTPTLFPESFAPTNYVEAAKRIPLVRLFFNSVLVTVIGAGIKVLLAIMTAYALVYVKFPFKNVIFAGILVTLMVPPQVSMLPNFLLISQLGGVNTYWGIILPGLGTGFGTFLLRQQFLSIPKSLTEAAEIDGAGHWRRLWQIVVPVSAPTIATVALVSIVFEWNDYLWPLIIITDPSMMTLPVGLNTLRNSEASALGYPLLMAGSVAIIVPVLIVFVALQRYIIAGLTQGAVKD
ncbi:carbohydrate ABC transporter membrane protein 2, CUT1 family [Pseudonocardia thermophila]|uniref:Carbohydrate ABC transporter membrane protein 2, CUT1 family n=1 Tax=Pseudonocardia thermophila TaxID=1848 RepID=A0A1M6Z6H5_PSETH|nr:carbohydrate ABC transporter permease [Pseudonocardia thermophila]SHL25992.1 carbohydrate ABC transporter membrane protein 2, CUT1 family [Pseudonocardia thermophila]